MMLGKKLRRFFEDRSHPVEGPRQNLGQFRYIPRAYAPTGGGWGVWDRREARYLDDAEVKALPTDKLMNEPAVVN